MESSSIPDISSMEELNLEELEKDSSFNFECGSQMPCYNKCCNDADIALSPYDVARLSRNLGLDSEQFLRGFVNMDTMPETGLPLPKLRMIQSPDSPCPFLSPAGCTLYEDRPTACRYYPLASALQPIGNKLEESFFLNPKSYCQGFGKGCAYTAQTFLKNQECGKYQHFNRRYMELAANLQAKGRYLDQRMAAMCFLCLYQLDKFRDLIKKMNIFSRFKLSEEEMNLILKSSEKGDEACLKFAFDWLNLALGMDSQKA